MLGTGYEKAAIENVSMPISDPSDNAILGLGTTLTTNRPKLCEATTSSTIANSMTPHDPFIGKWLKPNNMESIVMPTIRNIMV